MNVQVLEVTNVTPMLCVPTLRDLMSVDVLKVLREMVKPAQVKYDDFLYSSKVRPKKVHLIFGHTIFKQLLDEVRSCYIQNNRGRGRGYQPKPRAEADNPYRDLDYSPNLIIVLLYIERKNCFFTDGKQKARELDMITLRNHAPRS